MPNDRATINQLLNIIVDTYATSRKSIHVGREDKPADLVKAQLMKLTPEHIRYVVRNLSHPTTSIKSPKNYLLTALYNAPDTMDFHLQAECNYHMGISE